MNKFMDDAEFKRHFWGVSSPMIVPEFCSHWTYANVMESCFSYYSICNKRESCIIYKTMLYEYIKFKL